MFRARVFSMCLFLIVLSLPGFAAEFRRGNTVSIESSETIDDDVFIVGDNVLMAGRVKGDLFAAGRSVRITGPVEGSVMAAGREVQVSGNVAGSVRAAGQGLTLSGFIMRNAAIAGRNVVVTDSAKIQRDLHAVGETLDLDGAVGRGGWLAFQNAAVRSTIGSGLYFTGESLTLAPGAQVGGDVVYRSAQAPNIAAVGAGMCWRCLSRHDDLRITLRCHVLQMSNSPAIPLVACPFTTAPH